MKIAVFLISPLIALLGCSKPQPTLVENIPLQEEKAAAWRTFLQTREASYQKKLAAVDLPVPSKQLGRAVSRWVNECAQDHTRDPTEKLAHEEEIRCAHKLINDTLIQAGSDRAYEVSLAAKSVNPAWFVPIQPTYVLVD